MLKIYRGGTSGIRFDGEDDNLEIREFMPIKNPFTSLIEFELSETAGEQKALVYLGFGAYIHSVNDLPYIPWSTVGAVESKIAKNTNYKLVTASDGTFIGTDILLNGDKKTKSEDYNATSFTNKPGFLSGKKIIKKVIIWNRKLTEQELQQLA